MELFIPYITVQPAGPVNDNLETKISYNNISVPQNSEFQKVYFEELARIYDVDIDTAKNVADKVIEMLQKFETEIMNIVELKSYHI